MSKKALPQLLFEETWLTRQLEQYTEKQVAAKLHISDRTLRDHVPAVYKNLRGVQRMFLGIIIQAATGEGPEVNTAHDFQRLTGKYSDDGWNRVTYMRISRVKEVLNSLVDGMHLTRLDMTLEGVILKMEYGDFVETEIHRRKHDREYL